MREYYIPTNFEDNGKLLGLFGIRNVIEAGCLSLPFIYVIFKYVPIGLSWKIIVAAVFVVPIGGFALLGIHDDSLTEFFSQWLHFVRNRQIREYRGEVKC